MHKEQACVELIAIICCHSSCCSKWLCDTETTAALVLRAKCFCPLAASKPQQDTKQIVPHGSCQCQGMRLWETAGLTVPPPHLRGCIWGHHTTGVSKVSTAAEPVLLHWLGPQLSRRQHSCSRKTMTIAASTLSLQRKPLLLWDKAAGVI